MIDQRAPGIGVGHREPEDRRGTGETERREDDGIERSAAEQAQQEVERPDPQATEDAGHEQDRLSGGIASACLTR